MPAKKKSAEPRESTPEEETTDETVETTSADEAPADGPRPWRVETFTIGEDNWGWRLAAADGVVISETEPTFGSKDEALSNADEDERTEGAVFQDRERR